MSNSAEISIPLQGTLVAEAFEAIEGRGAHKSLGEFAAYCMTNGADGMKVPRCLKDSIIEGPELVALNSVRRIVGVGPKTEITEDSNSFYSNIAHIESRIEQGIMPAPFIMQKRNDGWDYLLDGNHSKMALARQGYSHWWSLSVKPLHQASTVAA